jgi:hypothetical protein
MAQMKAQADQPCAVFKAGENQFVSGNDGKTRKRNG